MSIRNQRMIYRAFAIVVAVIVVFSATSSNAQILSRGDLFGPGAPPPMIGVELGLGSHQQQGTYQAICHCQFEGGSATGFLGGLLFELPLNYEWTIGLGAKFDFKGLNNTTLVGDTATLLLPQQGDSVARGTVFLQRTGTVRETFLTLAPFVRYEFYRNGPFVQAGPSIGFLLSSNFKHVRELLGSTITLVDNAGNSAKYNNIHFANGTNTEELENHKIDNVKTLRLGLLLTVGYDIPVGDNSVIAPMLTYDLPLTTVRDNILSKDWKISTIFFSVGLKYKLD